MKYIKLFEDIDVQDEVQTQKEVQGDESKEETQGQSDGEYTELVNALIECVAKTSECVDKCEESDSSDCNRCMEANKVCETTLWCVENQSHYWKNMLEYCLIICKSTVEYCLKNGPDTAIDALMVFVNEGEKVIDGI